MHARMDRQEAASVNRKQTYPPLLFFLSFSYYSMFWERWNCKETSFYANQHTNRKTKLLISTLKFGEILVISRKIVPNIYRCKYIDINRNILHLEKLKRAMISDFLRDFSRIDVQSILQFTYSTMCRDDLRQLFILAESQSPRIEKLKWNPHLMPTKKALLLLRKLQTNACCCCCCCCGLILTGRAAFFIFL